MLERYGYIFRSFSKSSLWRSLEKSKPPESPQLAQSGSSAIDTTMSVIPSEFEKRILVYSGKFKSIEEIPSRVRYETINYAKSKFRIKLANILMGVTLLACLGVVFIGKRRQKVGDSLMKRGMDRDEELREEGRLQRAK